MEEGKSDIVDGDDITLGLKLDKVVRSDEATSDGAEEALSEGFIDEVARGLEIILIVGSIEDNMPGCDDMSSDEAIECALVGLADKVPDGASLGFGLALDEIGLAL